MNTFHFLLYCFYYWLWSVNCGWGCSLLLTLCACWYQFRQSFQSQSDIFVNLKLFRRLDKFDGPLLVGGGGYIRDVHLPELKKRWKAAEFLQFLLYTGLVFLEDFLSQKSFEQFLYSSVSIWITIANYKNEEPIFPKNYYCRLWKMQLVFMVHTSQCTTFIICFTFMMT